MIHHHRPTFLNFQDPHKMTTINNYLETHFQKPKPLKRQFRFKLSHRQSFLPEMRKNTKAENNKEKKNIDGIKLGRENSRALGSWKGKRWPIWYIISWYT